MPSVPLATDAGGVVRVGGTRVTLDTLVQAFAEGATPEEMIQQYPSLDLGTAYLVIGYYLRNRDEVNAYLRQREEQGLLVRQEAERRFDPKGLRARLLARQQSGTSSPVHFSG
jgi:uncharacterized protein (DUF433 family)